MDGDSESIAGGRQMQRLVFWTVAILVSAAWTGNAAAQSSCGTAGMNGTTLNSGDQCRQSDGRRQFSMMDGTQACTSRLWDCEEGYSLDLGNGNMLSGMRIAFDAGAIFTAPKPVGLLETGTPVTTPAYLTDVAYSGFKVGIGLNADLHTEWFTPMDLGVELEYGQLTGRGTGGSKSFAVLGVPSVGLINGAYVGAATTVNSTDITINRTWAALDKNLEVPFAEGTHDLFGLDTQYTAYGLVGTRFGGLSERQRIDILTTAGTVAYDTTLSGGLIGAYLGLGVDKSIALSDDLSLDLSTSFAAGLDFHNYRVTDSVSGTFGSSLTASTNSFDAPFTIPTFKLGTGAYVGTKNWRFGASTAVSVGYYPTFEVMRPISNQPSTPKVVYSSPTAWEILIGANARF